MRNDEQLIFERYLNSSIKKHNLIYENKCCESCGKFLTESEIEYVYGSDDVLTEATGKPNGYVIYEGTNVNGRYACIATGLVRESQNVKTGPMVQIFIINADVHPVEAIKLGKNVVQCYDCIHRPASEEEKAQGKEGGSCYVDVGKSVAQVYKTYKKGCYPNICGENAPEFGDEESYLTLGAENISKIFGGKKTRFGAYGEPINIPFRLMNMIANASTGHTGYTHQWKNPALQAYKKFCMASVDSPEEYRRAKAMGWRTFRVSTEWDLQENEMICMNSWKDKTCAECLLCGGGTANVKQDIIIKVHGKLKSKFKSSEALGSYGEAGDPTEKYDSASDPNPEKTEQHMNLSVSQRKQIQKAGELEGAAKQEKEENRSLKDFIKNTNKYKSERYPNKPRTIDKTIKKVGRGILKDLKKSDNSQF